MRDVILAGNREDAHMVVVKLAFLLCGPPLPHFVGPAREGDFQGDW